MALKKALGAAAGRVAGVAAFVLTAAIVLVLVTAYPGREDQTALTDGGDATQPVVEPPATEQPAAEQAATEQAADEPAVAEQAETEQAETEQAETEQAETEDAAATDVVVAQESAAPATAETSEAASDETVPEAAEAVETTDVMAEPAEPEMETVADGADESAVEEAALSEPLAPDAPTADQAPAPMRPSFDLVRIPPEGLSTVAGRAEPLSDVLIIVDGMEIARVTATAGGEFVSLFSLPSSSAPREMQLAALVDGVRLYSDSSVVIAPAVVVAAADTVPATAPAPLETPAAEGTAPTTPEAATVAAPVPAAPTVLMANDEGVQVLQSSGIQNAVLIDAITYDPDGNVFVSGRGIPGRTVRLYLNNTALTDTVVGSDGQWRTMMDVEAGLYTLRADMIDEAGAVLSRVEIPFKREEIALLAQIAARATHTETDAGAESADEGMAATDDTSVETAAVEPMQMDEDEADTEAMSAADSAGGKSPQVDTASDATPLKRVTSVTVQPGNSLWQIATKAYGEGVLYVRVFEANSDQIRDPDLIYPGQVFVLPE